MKCIPDCTCRRHVGHPQTEATRAAIAARHRGVPKTEEHRRKLSNAARLQWERHEGPAPNLGVPMPAATRARMSLGKIGNQNARVHGGVGTRTHNSWRDMLARCKQPRNPSYHRYGGRGISVCERWALFENFLADMGRRPEGTTLDRVDNSGNYERRNCSWATPTEQANNRG